VGLGRVDLDLEAGGWRLEGEERGRRVLRFSLVLHKSRRRAAFLRFRVVDLLTLETKTFFSW